MAGDARQAADSKHRLIASSFLEKLGYCAAVVGNGLEVLEATELKTYDVGFLDVQMPEMDSYEVARRLHRRWPDDLRPRLIAITGHAMQGEKERCLESGMDDYIAKPVSVDALCKALERWGRHLMTTDKCEERNLAVLL
jgi:CheY-like chemotaxis protein